DPGARFGPVEIPGHPGYPAVIKQSERDITVGYCPIFVGVTDDLTMVVAMRHRDQPEQACDGAVTAAASVINTLKQGA
ncbi:MAG: hypothetical protein ACRDQB_01505, partial [Thermocrispum sp.]